MIFKLETARQVWESHKVEELAELGILEKDDLVVKITSIRSHGDFEIVGCLTRFGFGYLYLSKYVVQKCC